MNTSRPFQRLHSPTGHDLTTLYYKGQPCWIAQEIGQVLGYSKNGSRLSEKITSDWSGEMLEGVDHFKVEGEELVRLRAAVSPFATPESEDANFAGPDLGPANPLGPKTRHLLLLTEQGVFLACIKSNKPAGVQLRRWLASEVLPALRRGELPPSMNRGAALDETLEARRVAVQQAAELRRQGDRLYRVRMLDVEAYAELLRRALALLMPDLHLLPRPQPSALPVQGVLPLDEPPTRH